MKKVRVEDAVGMILGHDLTKIVPGEYKGPAFKKGHIIREEDIDELKSMGKNHINVIEIKDNEIHENDATRRLGKAVAGEGLYTLEPSEGKVNIKACVKGLLKVNLKALEAINSIDQIILSTLYNNTVVEKDQIVAGTKIIPLTTKVRKIEEVESICIEIGKAVEIKEILPLKVGVVITGSEVFYGRITDKFAPVLTEKIDNYGGQLLEIKYAPDDKEIIIDAINNLLEKGAEIVLLAGGMSVDADDVTPAAISEISDSVVTYGTPVLPGAMFMVAYKTDIPLLGIPASALFHKKTVFDLIFPRALAKDRINRRDITDLAHGGLL